MQKAALDQHGEKIGFRNKSVGQGNLRSTKGREGRDPSRALRRVKGQNTQPANPKPAATPTEECGRVGLQAWPMSSSSSRFAL